MTEEFFGCLGLKWSAVKAQLYIFFLIAEERRVYIEGRESPDVVDLGQIMATVSQQFGRTW